MASFAKGYWPNMVYEKPDWDYKTFQLDAALKVAEEKTGEALNAINPDLKRFKARGGKLILYHGWNDPAITPLNTINYYNSVIAKMGEHETETFVRLYMAPGVQHCGGGPGPDSYGEVGDLNSGDPKHSLDAALEVWVEKGTAPSTVIASKFAKEDRQHTTITRPLCAYPQEAKYRGSGDTNDAASFVCAAGDR
jgi:feruloyl esterase